MPADELIVTGSGLRRMELSGCGAVVEDARHDLDSFLHRVDVIDHFFHRLERVGVFADKQALSDALLGIIVAEIIKMCF